MAGCLSFDVESFEKVLLTGAVEVGAAGCCYPSALVGLLILRFLCDFVITTMFHRQKLVDLVVVNHSIALLVFLLLLAIEGSGEIRVLLLAGDVNNRVTGLHEATFLTELHAVLRCCTQLARRRPNDVCA